jgi:hypothetical protein
MQEARVLSQAEPAVLVPPPGVGRAGWPVSLLCSRNAAHGTNRICKLWKVLVRRAHVEANRATLERIVHAGFHDVAAGARAPSASATRSDMCNKLLGGRGKK